MFALFVVAWNVVFVSRKHASALGSDVGKIFLICGVWTIFVSTFSDTASKSLILSQLWFLYPIAWGLSEGGNVIAPDSEAVFYGILDILAKPVFGALLLWGHRNIDPARLGMRIRDYEELPTQNEYTGQVSHEKHHTGTTGGVTNGAVNNGTPATTV